MSYELMKGYSASSSAIEGDVTTEGEFDVNIAASGTQIYADGTPVRVSYVTGSGQNKAFYGIYDGSVDKIFYDARVYSAETITGGLVYQYNNGVSETFDTFTLQSEITTATYSDAHVPYYSSVDFSIVTPLNRGSVNTLLPLLLFQDYSNPHNQSMVLVDRCDNFVYHVVPTTDTINSLNNKYATKLEFKVAKK